MNVQHSAASVLWYTPDVVLDAVREVLGDIELDPASDAYGNSRVGAARFLTEGDNGLLAPWGKPRSVFLNPPGGKVGNRSQTELFWLRLVAERRNFGHAVFMAFSAEALQTTQKPGQNSLMEFPFCVPSSRLRFHARGEAKHSPSHSNVVVYVPGRVDVTARFLEVFSAIGACKP